MASLSPDSASGSKPQEPPFTLALQHELRGQLSVIENCGALLEGTLPEGFSRQRILALHRIANRQLHDLLRQLEHAENTLGTSSTPSRKRRLTLRMLANVIDSARVRHTGRAIRVRLPLRLPSVSVDWLCLSSIITNLLDNALKYSRDEVYLRVACSRRCVRFFVHDRGRGIPSPEIARLGQPFHRASNSADTPGSGLGLYIIKSASERIGATLRIASRENRGTSVLVSLPRGVVGRPRRRQTGANRLTNAR